MTYADQVRRARNALDYSQEALAIAAGISTRTIQNVESGGNPGPETRRALAAVLGKALVDAKEIPFTDPAPSSATPRRERPDIEEPSRGTSENERTPNRKNDTRSCASHPSRPRRRSIGERISPRDPSGAKMLDFAVRMSVAMTILVAVLLLGRHYTEPTVWVTVESTGRIVTTQEEMETLSNLVENHFPDAGSIDFVSQTKKDGIVRRAYGIVAHGIDSSKLMFTLVDAGLTVFVSTIDSVPPEKGILG